MTLRLASAADAPAVTAVFLAAIQGALPEMRLAHTPEQIEDWYAAVVLPRGIGTVAVEADAVFGYVVVGYVVVGYVVVDGTELDQLYVSPVAQGRGVGSALLAHARTRSPDGLRLWTFQANAGARAFYETRGFVLTELTDGAGNEEREPDARYAWAPPTPHP